MQPQQSPGPPRPSGMGVLQIEPTDHCNLACRMCAPHAERWDQVHGVPKGFLTLELYEKIVDDLVADDCRFDHLILQWLGDPSLHPRLDRLVGIAGERLAGRLGYLRFDTNGVLLDERRMEAIAAAKSPALPLLAVFTIDAATPETYAAVKGRDHLPAVRRHVRRLLALRRGQRDLHVQVQFVVQAGNEAEAGDFLRYWQDAWACHGRQGGHFEVMFKRLSVSGGAAGQEEADRRYERAVAQAGIQAGTPAEGFSVQVWERRPWQQDDGHRGRGPCPGLWLTPVVRQDGQLLMCCADLQGGLGLGSLAEHRFLSLWRGEQARAHRRAHLAGRFEGPCRDCGGINWYGLTGDDIIGM